MAFEMFTGRVPFHDTEAPMAILLRHVNEQIPPVKSIDPKIDQDISDWIDRLLIKDPTQRTQSANDAWDEFEEIIIGLLGPRWRREARLREGSAQLDTPAPLTPAPFQGTTSDAAVSDEFQSFAWGNAVTPEQAPPGPATPPPSQSLPVPPEPVVGPPTPEPGPAVAADGSGPVADEQIDSGFVTFGAPTAEPETQEAAAPPAEAAAPEAAAPAAEPVQETSEAPTEEAADEGFETYIAPAPLRPPTDDAPPDAPAIPEPAPQPEPVAPAPDPEPVAAAPPPAPPPPPPAPAPPAPVAPDDDLAATVMPSSISPPPPTAPVEPEPVREPEPVHEPEEERERKGGKGALIGFGIAAIIAAIAGFVIGGGSGGSEDTGGGAPTAAASNADVSAKFPSDWKKISQVPEIPGYTFASPIAMAPGGAAGGEAVVLGQVKEGAANSSLLPGGLRSALGLDAGELPPRQPVQLVDNKLQAYRYPKLRPNGIDQPVTLYTVPTSAGVATVACVDPSADCESIANTLKLNAGTAFPVGPSKEYAAGLSKTLGTLNKKVQAGRKALRGADSPKQQAAAAKGLSNAYKSASASISKLETSPADTAANQDLASALKATGNAYGKMAAAASSGNKGAYGKASDAVEKAEESVAQALRGLEAAGYKLSD
jgi:hypothetical protein